MYNTTYRDIPQRQAVAHFNWSGFTRLQRVTSRYTLGSDNVTTLAVGVLQQGNVCRAIGIIFQALNFGGNPILVALEINNPVMLLVTTTNMPG